MGSTSKGKFYKYSRVCMQYIAYNVHFGLTYYLPGGLSDPIFCDHQNQYLIICDAECNLQSNW